MKTIIIDGKEIQISDESYENLKEQLVEKEFELEYPQKAFLIDVKFLEVYKYPSFDKDFLTAGIYRKTKENAEKSLKRMIRSNRLEALVEQIQGNLGGDHYIFQYKQSKKWDWMEESFYDFYPEVVLMEKETAQKICDMLNSGKFSLDIEVKE
jgi:hypothetical protein